MRINQSIFNGRIDRDLKVYFSFDIKGSEEKYPTITHPTPEKWTLLPQYGLFIQSGYNNFVYVGFKLYFQFVALLKRSVASISEHLYEIFPGVDNAEFEVNSRALEIYSTEKAMSTAGMKIVPCVWTNQGGDMCPGIAFTSDKNTQISIPFEDAIAMVEMLATFDPNNMALQMFHIFG